MVEFRWLHLQCAIMGKRPFSKRSEADADLRSAFEFHVSRTDQGCWLWTGPTFKKRGGYGCFTARSFGLIQQRAHRVAWTIYCGEIATSDHVLHTCDTPACVNPDHLFLGNQNANMADKVAKQRQDRGETHGMHKLTEEQAIAIRQDPRKLREIAAEFGVSVVTVSDIKRARSWSHLGPPVGRYKRAA